MIRPFKQGTFIGGKNEKGEQIDIVYDVFDASGYGAENEHIFTGTIQGHPQTAFAPERSTPSDAKDYQQANHSPKDWDVTPQPPKGHGPGTD